MMRFTPDEIRMEAQQVYKNTHATVTEQLISLAILAILHLATVIERKTP